jgi:hypothetical protein
VLVPQVSIIGRWCKWLGSLALSTRKQALAETNGYRKSQGQKGEGTRTVPLYFCMITLLDCSSLSRIGGLGYRALNSVFPFFRTNVGENFTR